jgi:dTDP-glucose 4,6-dehydratase
MKIVVTGGLGFIGSSFVKMASARMADVVVIDKDTYAADHERLEGWPYELVQKDICDDVAWACEGADYIVNFAAESHVDNSINNGLPFVKSNVEGTFNMLEIARKIPNLKKFIQISTDEVYGDVEQGVSKVDDNLIPSSYYSATKAAADHLVMAAGRTYGLSYLITRTCNNFGAHQHKEKFLPKIFDSIKNNKDIPVYGDGEQVREWIWVEDNVRAIWDAMLNDEGIIHIGSRDRWTNKEIIQKVGELLDDTVSYKFVTDRLGHDRRYALESTNETTLTLGEFLKEYARENLDT